MNLKESIKRILREKIENHNPLEGLFSAFIDGELATGKVKDLIKYTKKYPTTNLNLNDIPDIPHHSEPETNLYTMNANLKYPIIVMVNDDDEVLRVLDGSHRIQKALYLGDETIRAKLIPQKHITELVGKTNIKESIRRILKETREDKIKSILLQEFDKVFDELNLKVDYEENNYVYGKWFDKDGKDIFHRNDWGVIWIINCEPYKELYIYSKLVGLNEEEFEKILVEYFNNKYLDQFLQKPFKNVSDENHCLED